MTAPEAGLYTKLAEVMAAVGYVQKTGYNSFHKYHYVTETDLIEKVRGELTARNVMLIPSVVDIAERPITTDKGKQSTITTVRVAFTFVDGDTGAMHKAEWAGAGDDGADKGIYKAYTGALKYFLMKSFLIPTGDDPEAAAPAAPPEPPISAERATAIGGLISQALGAGIEGPALAQAFAQAGASPDKIDKQAVAALTAAQASSLEQTLDAAIKDFTPKPAAEPEVREQTLDDVMALGADKDQPA